MSRKTVVLITGATAGIGRETALHLAKKGYHVIAAGRREKALADLKRAARGLRLNTVRMDVDDRQSIAEAHREVLRMTDGYGVDVLVNNAGWGLLAPVIETTDEDLRKQYETNVFGLMAVTRTFAKEMLDRRSGRIINVSSVGGRVTLPFFGAYNSTKYAVESLSDAMRVELAPLGIRVSVIEPGLIRTNFADTSMGWVDKYRSETSPYAPVYARADELRKRTDSQAVGPEVIARAIEHAVSARRPRARYIAPFSAKIMVWLSAWLPTSWLDFAFIRLLGLRSENVAPALPEPHHQNT